MNPNSPDVVETDAGLWPVVNLDFRPQPIPQKMGIDCHYPYPRYQVRQGFNVAPGGINTFMPFEEQLMPPVFQPLPVQLLIAKPYLQENEYTFTDPLESMAEGQSSL